MAEYPTIRPFDLHTLMWTPEEWRAALPETLDRESVIALLQGVTAVIKQKPAMCSLMARLRPADEVRK